MEFVFLTLAIVVVGMYIYRQLTRKKREEEYFPEDFKDSDLKKHKKD